MHLADSSKYEDITMKRKADELIKIVFDLLAPRRCAVSGSLITRGSDKFYFLTNETLAAMPSADDSDLLINKIIKNKISPKMTELWGLFSAAGDRRYLDIIHLLKYQSQPTIGFMLGSLLGRKVMNLAKNHYDFVMPVPIHRLRKRQRGYNQALYIARGLSEASGIPLLDGCLIRHRYTTSQTQLSADERRANLRAAFSVEDKSRIASKNLILVDDVLTTGSTLNECATTLKDSAAKIVSCGVLAVA